MPKQFDDDRLHADWFQGEDPERAVASGVELFERVAAGKIDVVRSLPSLELAAEPVWDGPGGRPPLVREALFLAEPQFRRAEVTASTGSDLDSPGRIRLRGESGVLLARAWYHDDRAQQGFCDLLALSGWLRDIAGGHAALLETLARPTWSVVGEQAVGVLGLYPAALRRSGYDRDTYRDLLARGLELVVAYLRIDRNPGPVIYPRTPALASQWFFALVNTECGDSLVRALYDLDVATRPTDKRSLATTPLRDMEFAARFTDGETAEKFRSAVIPSLRSRKMERHEQTILRHSYLAA